MAAQGGRGVVGGLRGLGPKRLALMGLIGVALLAMLAVLALRAGEPPMAPLFGELEQRDAAAIVASLERQRIPYKIAGGGTQVLAPLDQVQRLRLTLAREGLPAGGGVGWEIFDRGASLTDTPFQQGINQLRALEGELARTIRGLAGVKSARVHLVLPRREAFSRERGEAQASVILAMQGAQRLDREAVQAVLHLVATAVPNLRAQNISIVDSRGELLARGGQALTGPAAAATQDELRRAQEMRLARSVEELLERTLGPGRVRAEATVELDFDRVETRDERFDPENQVARSTQSTTEQSKGAEPPPTSVQGNLPAGEGQGGGSGTSESRQEETTNFEIGRRTTNTLREHPVLKRQSIAVLVDGVVEPGEGGAAPKRRERTTEELARIASLVRGAVGINEQRGDKLEVVSMPFVEEPASTEGPEQFLGLPVSPVLGTRLIESVLMAVVALVAILLVGRPMVSRIAASLAPQALLAQGGGAVGPGGVPIAGPGGVVALPGGGGGGAGGTGALAGGGDPDAPPADGEESMVSLAHVQGQMKASSLNALIQLVEAHPDESLNVLRRWLNPEAPPQ